MAGYITKDELIPSLVAEIEEVNSVNTTVTNLSNTVNVHLNEGFTTYRKVLRDSTLTGLQTITLDSNRKPKYLIIKGYVYSGVGGFPTNSIGTVTQNGQSVVATLGDGKLESTETNAVLLGLDRSNYAVATVTIREGYLDFNWSLVGTMTGLMECHVDIFYHGGNA